MARGCQGPKLSAIIGDDRRVCGAAIHTAVTLLSNWYVPILYGTAYVTSTMETEERPTKLRKLNDGAAEPEQASAGAFVVEAGVLGQASDNALPSDDSKPRESAANVADPIAIEGSLPATVSPEGPSADDQATTLSKSQLKKLRKKQEWEAGRDDRKVKRREKTKERKARKRVARREEEAEAKATGQVVQLKTRKPLRPVHLPVTFVIDCGFDDLMIEKERISLGSQVTRAYSDNSRAPFQAQLVVSSWGGKLKERFETVLSGAYHNWSHVEFLDGDFVEAANAAKDAMGGKNNRKLAGAFQKYALSIPSRAPKAESDPHAAPHAREVVPEEGSKQGANGNGLPSAGPVPSHDPESAQKEIAPSSKMQNDDQPALSADKIDTHEGEVIYLTSDSPYTLDELKPYSTYIIGGLVDKNRHKGICYKTAMEKGIKTAKLPISEYMEMQSRFVLATNHVVEIMVRWLECGDWGKAFMQVMPKRKGGKLRVTGSEEASNADTPQEELVDDEDDIIADCGDGEEVPDAEVGDDTEDEVEQD